MRQPRSPECLVDLRCDTSTQPQRQRIHHRRLRLRHVPLHRPCQAASPAVNRPHQPAAIPCLYPYHASLRQHITDTPCHQVLWIVENAYRLRSAEFPHDRHQITVRQERERSPLYRRQIASYPNDHACVHWRIDPAGRSPVGCAEGLHVQRQAHPRTDRLRRAHDRPRDRHPIVVVRGQPSRDIQQAIAASQHAH